MRTEKNIHISFNAPLNPDDTENQTFGCRANNPDICGNNGIKDICAFCSDDNICRNRQERGKENTLS